MNKYIAFFLVIFSGCHICHEELKPLVIMFGFIPFLGTYISTLWHKQHNKKCVHNEPSFMFDVAKRKSNPELTKLYLRDIRREKFDAFLTPAAIYNFSSTPPYILYNTTVSIKSTKAQINSYLGGV
jgi:hypothetical protein